ncbi:L-galactono-1,4-lactone dehydrogenase 2, mitochondrial-like [Vigna radiata var. radiata]|uniref:L-galactono-1,4-lactone dehydrogenase 2, mitochondrial-like n=1 Tax=Vigna radiata var. radiata TaxID=3916 RepID=A0A1S3TS90_VIGRR|nr:L-galactono-1,4-lactone dehydrogenase 2, mitochondrial-like [Vigna radiata var. radiata]
MIGKEELQEIREKYVSEWILNPDNVRQKEVLQYLQFIVKGSRGESAEEQKIDELSFTELRDKLIALDPLNKKNIISINQVEYIEELKQLLKNEEIPTPAPVEQHWATNNRSPLSPASNPF